VRWLKRIGLAALALVVVAAIAWTTWLIVVAADAAKQCDDHNPALCTD
jgi:hypothetical protein